MGLYTEIPSDSEIEINFVGDEMKNPEIQGNVCKIINVDRCYVVYPSKTGCWLLWIDRFILYLMYSLCLVMLVTTISVYSMYYFRKAKKVLPITTPNDAKDSELKSNEEVDSTYKADDLDQSVKSTSQAEPVVQAEPVIQTDPAVQA